MNTRELLEIKEVLDPIIQISLKDNYETIILMNEYINYYKDFPPRNKIDTKIKLLKQETRHYLTQATNDIETVFSLMKQIPITHEILNLCFKLTNLVIPVWNLNISILQTYFFEDYYPLTRRVHRDRYTIKRQIIKRLNKAKRGFRKIHNEVTKIQTKLTKMITKTRKPTRLVLNANDWINGIIEHRYNNLVAEDTENINKIRTVEEKTKIKQKIRKQI